MPQPVGVDDVSYALDRREDRAYLGVRSDVLRPAAHDFGVKELQQALAERCTESAVDWGVRVGLPTVHAQRERHEHLSDLRGPRGLAALALVGHRDTQVGGPARRE